jgi:translation initiation factor IF-3
MNERIRAQSVRLIETDGRQTGVVPFYEALRRARSLGLDLVQVAKGDVPVCKILDADRWRFEQAKAAREQSRRQREMQVETKEVQLRPVTDDNDLGVKSRRARGFLAEGDKVKVVVRFKGRERAHRDEGRKVVERFLAMVGDHKVDSPLQNGEKDMVMVLAPIVSKSEIVRARHAPVAQAAE